MLVIPSRILAARQEGLVWRLVVFARQIPHSMQACISMMNLHVNNPRSTVRHLHAISCSSSFADASSFCSGFVYGWFRFPFAWPKCAFVQLAKLVFDIRTPKNVNESWHKDKECTFSNSALVWRWTFIAWFVIAVLAPDHNLQQSMQKCFRLSWRIIKSSTISLARTWWCPVWIPGSSVPSLSISEECVGAMPVLGKDFRYDLHDRSHARSSDRVADAKII